MLSNGARAGTIALALAISLAACSEPPGPLETPSPSPISTSPTPGAEPDDSMSPTAPPEFRQRNPAMTDTEALSRLTDPTTSEFWLTEPRPLETPSWAQGDAVWDSDVAQWWELGRRGSSSIMGVGYPSLLEFFEVDADDQWTWVVFPSPRQEAVTTDLPATASDEVARDPYIYYDSLALPDAITLTSGEPLLVPIAITGRGLKELPSIDDSASATLVTSVGGYDVLRHERPVAWVWSQQYDVTAPAALSYRDVFYTLEAPYGMSIPLTYSPFGILEDVTWEIDTEFGRADYMVDINDISCGQFDTDHNTVVDGMAQSDWVRAGVNNRGDSVYVPSDTNPLRDPMHQVFRQAQPDSTFGIQRFVSVPAIVGYYSRDIGAWVVYLNSSYSGRTWC